MTCKAALLWTPGAIATFLSAKVSVLHADSLAAIAQGRLIRQALRQPADLDQITVDQWFQRIGKLQGVTLLDGESLTANAVICAVPVWKVKGLLDQVPGHDVYYRAVEHLTPVPIVSVNLYLDRCIGMDDWDEILYGGEGVPEQHSHIVRMPYSTFAQRSGTAGVRPPQKTAVRGLAIAGDWIQTD